MRLIDADVLKEKAFGFLSYYGESDDPAWRRVTNVVAWMDLPEPWRAQS